MNEGIDTYQIESTVYVEGTKFARALIKILKISIVIVIIGGVLSIIDDAFKVSSVGKIGLYFVLLKAYIKNNGGNNQFAFLDLSIESGRILCNFNGVKVGSYTGLVQYEILGCDIQSIEYAQESETLRIKGNINRLYNNKKEKEKQLIMSCPNCSVNVVNSIEEKIGCKVSYIY